MRFFMLLIGTGMLGGVGLVPSAFAQQAAPAFPAGHYVLDPRHATVLARLKHQGFSNYTLRFTGLAAQFNYDPATPKATNLSVTVDTRSIDTATGFDAFGKAFDAELLGQPWLDGEHFPTMTFVSTAVDAGDGHHGTITGNLTLHGVTKPVTLQVAFNGYGKGVPAGEMRAGFSASTTIKRSEFGVTKYVPLVSDEVQLVIEAEFIKQ